MADRDDGMELSIGAISVPEYLRPVYANYVGATFTPWDFRLTFCLIKSPGSPAEVEATAGVVHPEAVTEVIVPANLMASLLTMLGNQFDGYIKQYGVPGMNPGGPLAEGGSA